MEGAKICPVAKADCRKEQCAWWDKYLGECAVVSMTLALWADVDEDEEDGEEDENKDEEIAPDKEAEDEEDKEFTDGEVKEFKIKIKRLD